MKRCVDAARVSLSLSLSRHTQTDPRALMPYGVPLQSNFSMRNERVNYAMRFLTFDVVRRRAYGKRAHVSISPNCVCVCLRLGVCICV